MQLVPLRAYLRQKLSEVTVAVTLDQGARAWQIRSFAQQHREAPGLAGPQFEAMAQRRAGIERGAGILVHVLHGASYAAGLARLEP